MADDPDTTERRYTAPALEKGLDIIEFLAAANAPCTVAEISQGLGRSRGELFRMLSVLQHRGIIDKSESGDAFAITDRLFSLRLQRSFATQITTIAVPEMERFCVETGQSCHLALRSKHEIVVVMRVEHPENLSISVPVGHRRHLHEAPSGRCILAFSDPSLLEALMDARMTSKAAKLRLQTELEKIRAAGYAKMTDGFAVGVNGISAPIINQVDKKCDFALTTSVFERVMEAKMDQRDIAESICKSAQAISANYYI